MTVAENEITQACPLCSSDALYATSDYGCTRDGEWTSQIFCTDCGLTMMISRDDEETADADVLEGWNNR